MIDDWEKDSAINSAECYKLAIDQLRVRHVMKEHGPQGHVQFDGKPIFREDDELVRPADLKEGDTYVLVPFDGGWRFKRA